MVIGKFETRHYSFMVVGKDEEHVRVLMAAAWEVHARENDADPKYFEEYAGDMNMMVIPAIQWCVLRDGEVILEGDEPSRPLGASAVYKVKEPDSPEWKRIRGKGADSWIDPKAKRRL